MELSFLFQQKWLFDQLKVQYTTPKKQFFLKPRVIIRPGNKRVAGGKRWKAPSRALYFLKIHDIMLCMQANYDCGNNEFLKR